MGMQIIDLTTEYQKNPIGFDGVPRFSWKMESGKPNTMQQSYQIRVKDGGKIVWDSGRVESGQSLFIEYRGDQLAPYTVYSVEVRVWDNHGETNFTQGIFETGLLFQENWQAEWITHSLPDEEAACPVFTRKFCIEKKKIVRARAYVTCLGVYELTVNGKKAGDAFLAPGWTSYHNRLQYQTYDITGLLVTGGSAEEDKTDAQYGEQESAERQIAEVRNAESGSAKYKGAEREGIGSENLLEITVGNGWYKGYLNGDGQNCFYGNQTAVLAMLRIVYEDGSVQTIGTDTDFQVRTGIIRSSELYHGEVQDFSFQSAGVRSALSDEPDRENQTRQAVLFAWDAQENRPQIIAQQCDPVRIVQRLPAREKMITPKGELVIDFGQNLAGFVEVRLPELSGEALKIFHAETLDKEGNFYTDNLRTAKSTDVYLYGKQETGRVVHPHFTYHGFRYIRIEGVDESVDQNCFTACALHTDMEQTGYFSCSHELVDRLQSNIEWGQRSNFVDIPTDCPQRDERLGWTGDAQIFCRTAMYQFQTALFYKKWLRDMAAESDDIHGIPQLVPNFMGASQGTSVWSDSAVIIPWTLYQVYGDQAVLREEYPMMRSWIDYISKACGEDILWMNGFQRGDWLGLDGDESLHSFTGGTDKNLVANAYYAYSCRIVRDTARILGEQEDAAKYGALYERIVTELNREYVTPNGRLVSETQTACVLFLYFDLIKEEYKDRVIAILEENLNRHHGHLTTGFVGTAYLCHALTENGRHNLAENILLTQDYPGWLYAVRKGATTVWERWNSILPNGDFDESGMNSLNHYSYGAIGDWLYRKVAGIDQLECGYKKILIKPVLTKGMSEVKASYHSMYGEIATHISCKDGKITVDVVIPANTTAVLDLPERNETMEVGSGSWHYEYATDTDLGVGAFSMNSTFEQILASEKGAEVLRKCMPEIAGSPMMDFLKRKTLNEVIAMAPQQKEQIETMLAMLMREKG